MNMVRKTHSYSVKALDALTDALCAAQFHISEIEIFEVLPAEKMKLVKKVIFGSAEIITPPNFNHLSHREVGRDSSKYVKIMLYITRPQGLAEILTQHEFSEAEIIKLAKIDLCQLRLFLFGKAEIKHVGHIIKTDQRPTNGFFCKLKMKTHIKIPPIVWEDNKCKLLQTAIQKEGRPVYWSDAAKEFEGKIFANAVVAQYLEMHPWLIPSDWEGKYVFFPGTIYTTGGKEEYCLFLEKITKTWQIQISLLNKLGPGDYVGIIEEETV